MALTLDSVRRHVNRGVRTNVFDVTFDSSYPTGGEALTAASLGLRVVDSVNAESVDGYVFSYDRANSKILAYRQKNPADAGGADIALTQVGNTTDLSAVVVRVTATGK